jgi:hypothetical protein
MYFLPVEPLRSWNRAVKSEDLPDCGTGMGASHVDLPARYGGGKSPLSPASRAPLTGNAAQIQQKMRQSAHQKMD